MYELTMLVRLGQEANLKLSFEVRLSSTDYPLRRHPYWGSSKNYS